MPRRSLTRLYQDEFSNYSLARFQQDLLAGLTVAAVALPLALAFGVGSGATAAAGLVTAILAGFIMGLLGGAPYRSHAAWVANCGQPRVLLQTKSQRASVPPAAQVPELQVKTCPFTRH